MFLKMLGVHPDSEVAPTLEQTAAMRNAVLSQTFSIFAHLTFTNGTMLVFLTFMNVSSERTVLYLSIPFIMSLFNMPLAYLADCRGKKRTGVTGALLSAAGFVCMFLASWFQSPWAEILIVLGIVIYAFGYTMFNSCWFALMNPVVPEQVRGRFWGTLRLCWQIVAIAFAAACAVYLSKDTSVTPYRALLIAIAVSLVIRVFFYRKIPELKRGHITGDGFFGAVKKVATVQDYLPYCAYVFLLSLATASCPMLFGLIEKKVLALTDGQVVWLGGIGMAGAVLGFYLGGRAVDRFGTRPVFMVCHLGFVVAISFFLARSFLPLPVLYTLGAAHFLFGSLIAGSSVAVTTEMMLLIPLENQSLSTSFCLTLRDCGVGLSGLLISAVLSLNILTDRWMLLSASLSNYDALLLGFAVAIVLLVVTLGLVPSVISKSRWMPGA